MVKFRDVFVAALMAMVSGAPLIAQDAKPLFSSKVVDEGTPGHAVDIDVDVTGSKELYLVVTDGGDGFSADWADWAEPRFVTPQGEKKLTDLKWKSASTGWGQVRFNQNANGQAMRINGKPVEYGIGTHANSVIVFEVPEGATRFKARAGIDNGGSDQGLSSSVSFVVYNQKPKLTFGGAAFVNRDPVLL